jgi:hypothetical protein
MRTKQPTPNLGKIKEPEPEPQKEVAHSASKIDILSAYSGITREK